MFCRFYGPSQYKYLLLLSLLILYIIIIIYLLDILVIVQYRQLKEMNSSQHLGSHSHKRTHTVPILFTLKIENSGLTLVQQRYMTVGTSQQKSFSIARIFQSQWGICAKHVSTIIIAVLANNMFGQHHLTNRLFDSKYLGPLVGTESAM